MSGLGLIGEGDIKPCLGFIITESDCFLHKYNCSIKGDLAHSTSPPSRRSSIPSKNCIETTNLSPTSRRFRLSQSRTQLSFQGSPLLDRSTACRKNFVHCLADGPLPRPVMSIGFRIPERKGLFIARCGTGWMALGQFCANPIPEDIQGGLLPISGRTAPLNIGDDNPALRFRHVCQKGKTSFPILPEK